MNFRRKPAISANAADPTAQTIAVPKQTASQPGNSRLHFPTFGVRRTGYLAIIPVHVERASILTTFIDWLEAEGRNA